MTKNRCFEIAIYSDSISKTDFIFRKIHIVLHRIDTISTIIKKLLYIYIPGKIEMCTITLKK